MFNVVRDLIVQILHFLGAESCGDLAHVMHGGSVSRLSTLQSISGTPCASAFSTSRLAPSDIMGKTGKIGYKIKPEIDNTQVHCWPWCLASSIPTPLIVIS